MHESQRSSYPFKLVLISLCAAACGSGGPALGSTSLLDATVEFGSRPDRRFRGRILFIYLQRENRRLITQKLALLTEHWLQASAVGQVVSEVDGGLGMHSSADSR